MNSEEGDDVWGSVWADEWADEGFLNDLIQEAEKASAAAVSSGGTPSHFSRDTSRPPPSEACGNAMASASTAALPSAGSWYIPPERQPPSSFPQPAPVRVASSRVPAPAPLAHDGAQAAWNGWDALFAARNLVVFASDGGVDNRGYDFSPPRKLSQREKRTDSSSATEERTSVKASGSKNVGRGRGSAGGVKVEREKDKEIERLKRELERVLRKLDSVECENHELQKDRTKKEKELECAFSEIMARDAELECLKNEEMLPSKQNHSLALMQPHYAKVSVEQDVQFPVSEVKGAQSLLCHVQKARKESCSIANEPAASLRDPSLDFLAESHAKKRKTLQPDEPSAVSQLNCRIKNDDGLSTSNGCFVQSAVPPKEHFQLDQVKAVGIQTEMDNSHLVIGDASSLHDISSKLLSIWDSPIERISGRLIISRLLVSCSTHLYMLFRLIGIPSNINMESLTEEEFFDVALHDPMHSVQSPEAQKVSRLYSVMMKIRNDVARLNDLLDILMELCVLGNVIIVHRSLCILHAVLQTICFKGSYKRDSIVTPQCHDNMFQDGERRIRAVNMGIGFQESGNACNIDRDSVALPSGSIGLQDPRSTECKHPSSSSSLSLSYQISLFQAMHKIVVSNTKANVQVKALMVMNLILLRSDPISERGKLGLIPSFTSVSHILHMQVNPCMKRQAVKLLFLLLNCPNLLRIFCVGLSGEIEHMESAVDQGEATRLQESISTIPGGLADCIAQGGSCIQNLMLSREAIILLAFIASSGKSGFEILLSPISKQGNFIALMVKVLASLVDTQADGLSESQDLHTERTALIREALILLNRLASNTVYSKTTLGVLTQDTPMATLAVDVANRLCQKVNSYCKHGNAKKAQMEAEIVDLARLFRTRILSFLGENLS